MDNQKHFKIKSGPSTMAAAKMAALRAEVELELQNKKHCGYKPFECTQLALDNYNYCMRHILEDKTAPFKQCSYVYITNGKRCYLPAPKGDKKEHSYCNEHALKAHLSRTKQSSRYPVPHTAEVLLHSLSHYVKKPRTRTTSSSTQCSDEGGRLTPDENDTKVTKHLDPFVEIDAQQINASCSDILDMCSESESDIEPSTYSSVWQDAQAESSENESIDSEQEDVLKHANVYTAEEITHVTREKLIKLQSLYIDEYRHLQYLLKERRRKYLHALKREKETYCSIHNQIKDNPKEQRLYKKLKAYNRFHKKNGIEAILSKRVNELRLKITEGMTPKANIFSKCTYTEGGVKCGEKALPSTKHCRKHILEDPNQVLFRACGKMKAEIECTTPVEAIFDDSTCPLHMEIPAIRSYAHIRKDSESDYDDTMENNNTIKEVIKTNEMCNIKKEDNNFDIIDVKMEEIHKEISDAEDVHMKEEQNDLKQSNES